MSERFKVLLLKHCIHIARGNVEKKYSVNFPFLDIFVDKTYCLTMYYHMYGDTTNTLTVRTQKGNNAAIDRWQRAGDHGNAWYRLSGLSLPLDPDTKVIKTYRYDAAVRNWSV